MKLICDGCNVNPPFEHRCHRALAIVRGEPTGKRCECPECKEVAKVDGHDPDVCGCEDHAAWCPFNPNATELRNEQGCK